MSKPEQRPELLNEGVWPPPPNSGPQLLPQKSRLPWFRPAFWLGVGFNVLACVPALLLLKEPSGSEQMSDDIHLAPLFAGSLPIAVLALLIGVPIAVWQMRKRQRKYQSAGWEIAGLLLCFTPFFSGWTVLEVVLNVKAFDSLGEVFVRPPT